MEAIVFVKNVYKITGIGSVLVVMVKSGILRVGMKVNVNGNIMIVRIIEQNKKQVPQIQENELAGLSFLKSNYNLLKACIGKEVKFSEDGSLQTLVPVPTQSKGILDLIKGFFKK